MDISISPSSEVNVLSGEYGAPGMSFLALFYVEVYMNVRRYWGRWPVSFIETSIIRP